jgi:hypothetical protein
MPSSTLDALCQGRIAYTGESWECALTELRDAPHGTPIPDAASTGQAALESDFLEVIGRCDKDRWEPYMLPFAVTSVTPRPDELVVRIPREYLPDIICDLMPLWLNDEDETEVSGIPGLRAEVRRDAVRLHRPGLPGCISIPCPAQQWHKAVTVAADLLGSEYGEGWRLPWLTGQREWEPKEAGYVESWPRRYSPVGWQYRNTRFASQILRRLPGLCPDPRPYFHDLWFNRFGDTCSIEFEWAFGTEHKPVIDLLLDPLFGPGAEIALLDGQSMKDCTSGLAYRVNVRSSQQPQTWISLRRLTWDHDQKDHANVLATYLRRRCTQRAAVEARHGY